MSRHLLGRRLRRGQLWLSTDDTEANQAMIAEVLNWTGEQEWETQDEPALVSGEIAPAAGQQ